MGTDAAAIAALSKAAPPAWVATEFPSEQPAHKVTLTTGYWIDKYEVTNEAFARFVDAGGYTTRANWSDAGWDRWRRGRRGPRVRDAGPARQLLEGDAEPGRRGHPDR
jgi:formylglycine-generating enzyme required for sulfatase activity